VPVETREALNLESGLNDGICVPVVVTCRPCGGTKLSTDRWDTRSPLSSRRSAIGLITGPRADRHSPWPSFGSRRSAEWISAHWLQVPVCLGRALFRRSASAGGSWLHRLLRRRMLFSYLHDRRRKMLGGAASTGRYWPSDLGGIWRAAAGPPAGTVLTWSMLIYAVLKPDRDPYVPVIPVARRHRHECPQQAVHRMVRSRGLASIVFGVIVFDAGVPGRETIAVTVVCTVLLSIILHGATANPLITALRRSGGNGG